MTVAAETRAAVRDHPFLETALRADVVNYTAAARFLDVGSEDEEAVIAALRRYAAELDDYAPPARRASVSMQSGVRLVPGDGTDGTDDGTDDEDTGAGEPTEPLLVVGGQAVAADGRGEHTAVLAEGDIDAAALGDVLARLRTAGVDVVAAGGAAGTIAIVVERRAGPDAVRAVEAAL